MPTNTVQEKSLTKYCSFMPVEIYLDKGKLQNQEYETILAGRELLTKILLLRHIIEEAKTEESRK